MFLSSSTTAPSESCKTSLIYIFVLPSSTVRDMVTSIRRFKLELDEAIEPPILPAVGFAVWGGCENPGPKAAAMASELGPSPPPRFIPANGSSLESPPLDDSPPPKLPPPSRASMSSCERAPSAICKYLLE